MPQYEMWDSSGSEPLDATDQVSAIQEMYKHWPWWGDGNSETALHEVESDRARIVYPDGTVSTWDEYMIL